MADWVVVAHPKLASEAEAIREMLDEEGIVAQVVERADPITAVAGPSAEVRVGAAVADIARTLIDAWRGQVSDGMTSHAEEKASAVRWGAAVVLGFLLLLSVAANVLLYARYARPYFTPVWTEYDASGFPNGEARYREGSDRPYQSVQWSKDRKVTTRFFDEDIDGWFERSEQTVLGTHGEVAWTASWADRDEDGKTETGSYYRDGELISRASDLDRDGAIELEEGFKGGDLVTRCEDRNRDLNVEVCTLLDGSREIAKIVDRDTDGFYETSECLVPRAECPLKYVSNP